VGGGHIEESWLRGVPEVEKDVWPNSLLIETPRGSVRQMFGVEGTRTDMAGRQAGRGIVSGRVPEGDFSEMS
jgi:hypothetical protein